MIEVELEGLEVFGRHGVLEEERRDGQTFLFDLTLALREPSSDRIGETVDYRKVAARIREVSDAQAFQLLESLAGAVADALMAAFPLERVQVRVRKRPIDLPAEHAAAIATRP